jgi:DNA-binding CsgD family transcriptional regulator
MSNDVRQNRTTIISIGLFAAVTLLITWDLVFDYSEGASIVHLAVESVLLLVALSGIVVLWRQLRRTRQDLAEAIDEADQWRRESRELIRGLAVAIEHQFERWELTKAEAEVGLLMLKGLSHKEIALVRDTSERTIREQARAVYRKSGLSGKSALSAYFLEDLLLPPET